MGRRKTAGLTATSESPRQADFPNCSRRTPLSLYLDTSALVKLYLDEDGAELIRRHVQDEPIVATSLIAYVEARAAFTRHRLKLSSAEYRRIVAELDAEWDRYLRIDVNPALARLAGTLAERHGLRAYDAIHLASALEAGNRLGALPRFACWDRALNAAAVREGLALLR